MIRSVTLLFVLFLSLPLVAQATTPAAVPQQRIVIAHVTVIDVKEGRALPDMAVFIEGDSITAVRPARNVAVPAGARVIDAAGRYLIPGLWDMHAHLVRTNTIDNFLPLVVALGITGIRDMGTAMPLEEVHRLRREIAAGVRVGPRFVASGRILDGPKPINPTVSVAIHDAAEGRAAVRRHKAGGADFIKVYSVLPRDAYLAVIDEAKQLRIPVAGHVPLSVTAAEALRAGQVSMEHMFGVTEGCSTDEDALRERALATGTGVALIRSRASAVDSYSPDKAAKLFRLLAKNETWQVPSFVNQYAGAHRDLEVPDTDPRWKFIPAATRERWKASSQGPMIRAFKPEEYAKLKEFVARELKLIGEMHRAGVPFLAGTDTPVAFMFPGFSLHEELAFFVQAGLTPAQALQTATINPARLLKMEKILGTVEAGKRADLVLLSGNPLSDIENTLDIEAVVANGRYLDRAALDQILEGVEEAARATPTTAPAASEQ